MRSTSLSVLGLVLAFAAVLALSGTPAHAATYLVTKTADTNDGVCNADCSLREAVRAANASAGADTITLPAGVYTLSITGPSEEFAATADLDITDSLTINGADAVNTVIDGDGATLGDRVIQITGAFAVSLSGVTIRNGNTTGEGGGIYNVGMLTINNSTVSDSDAGVNGGGIFTNGTLTLNNSIVTGNTASNSAGGIANIGAATITSSTVSGNSTPNTGGGITTVGPATLASTAVTGNTATFGGGIYIYGGTADLTNSNVSGNSAVHGGGIFNETTGAVGTVSLTGSTVASNTVTADGGGMFNRGNATLSNSVVGSSNDASGNGAGIYNDAGTLILNGSAVSDNNAGGVIVAALHNTASGTANLNNSNVSGNLGIGIYNEGNLTLTDSASSANALGILDFGGTAILNDSVVGSNLGLGGIYNGGGNLVVTNTMVSGNVASGFGVPAGGISNQSGTMTLTNSTVSGNVAGNGATGGIANNGNLTLTNSTVSGNGAGLSGTGGIRNTNSDATVTLLSTTVADNSGSYTAILNDTTGTVRFKNSIVAGTCTGTVTSNGYNLVSDSSCPYSSPGDIFNVSPNLAALAYNGGPTQTHALLFGSPALNNGAHACPAPATDQRGVSRPQGPRCDIGAFEASDADGDATPDAWDDNDDNDGLYDYADPCPLVAEDYDGFQDNDGCPDSDNDLDGVLDVADTGKACFDPAATLSCPTTDCRNAAEDIDAFKDMDGCPEPDNDNDSFPDVTDTCPGTDAGTGANGMFGAPQDANHNGIRDGAEAVFTTDDVLTYAFEDRDGVLDTDGCHDSPGEDFDGDGYTDDDEALKIGTNAGYPCGNSGWPSDLVSTGSSLNKVDIFDIVSFVAPVRMLDKSPGPGSPYNPRWDLKPGATFPFTNHINIVDITTLTNGPANSPAYPQMLGGLRAFDKTCPLAPQ